MTAAVEALTSEVLEKELLALAGWEVIDNQLVKLFQFNTFMDAVGFVNKLAQQAETENHHPDIEILFNMVRVKYWTHTVDAITEKDVSSALNLNKNMN